MADKNFVSYGDAETLMTEVSAKIADAKSSKGYVQIGTKSTSTPNATATVEGTENVATGTSAHAEGYQVSVTGDYSHGEGANNIVSGDCSSVGGGGVYLYEYFSDGEYTNTIPSSSQVNTYAEIHNNVEGDQNLVNGFGNSVDELSKANIVSGGGNVITGSLSNVVAGISNKIDTTYTNSITGNKKGYISGSIIGGESNTITGKHNLTTGSNNLIDGIGNLIVGRNNTIKTNRAVIVGQSNKIDRDFNGADSLIVGDDNELYSNEYLGKTLIVGSRNAPNPCGKSSAIIGMYQTGKYGEENLISGSDNEGYVTYSHAGCGLIGNHLINNGAHQVAVGYLNKAVGTEPSYMYTRNPSAIFYVGCGSSTSARANAFRVASTAVYGAGAYNSSGADYAEMFEWADGNTENEDRRGIFVTLDGENISPAGPNDFILGIVSGNPSVCADVYDDQYKGMYEVDIFGSPIWEDIEYPEKTVHNRTVDDETGKETFEEKIIPAHTVHRRKLNPDYDDSKEYIARSDRPEWSAVGMLGKLVMVDDGTAEVNGYVRPADDGSGIATASESQTKYRVMSRLDETHIRILVL